MSFLRPSDEPSVAVRQLSGWLEADAPPPLLIETFESFRERTGHTILERYGMSETVMLTSNPYDPADGERRFEEGVANLVRRYPSKFAFKTGDNEPLSHRIVAGAEFGPPLASRVE